jgi:DNA (cytosine-5)-methyltransferase 1
MNTRKTTISQVSYLSVGQKGENKRLWLEGKKMDVSGFTKGQAYKTVLDVQSKSVTLILDDDGDKKVSGRQKNGRVRPIIEICNASITQHIDEVMGGVKRVRVVFKAQRIQISVHADEQKKITREEQIRRHIAQGILSEATLCAGGTISNRALHEGFETAGINSVTEFIVEKDGKYIQSAIDNNPYITDDTVIFEATLEEMEPELIKDVLADKGIDGLDTLNVSLPCTGMSSAGKSKNKISMGEQHASAGTAVVGLLKIFQATNPSIIISENVPAFGNSATKSILEGYFKKTGYVYVVKEAVLGKEMGAFEDRKRHIMVAVSEGLSKDFDLKQIKPSAVPPKTLDEVLDDIPDDSDMWQSYEYLRDKERRDLAAGKNFKRQLLDPDSKTIGVIGRGYNKARSTEPFVRHPTDPEKSRLLTVAEHARVKGIPEDIVANQSKTVAHEILGQSVLYPVFKSVGALLGSYLKQMDILDDQVQNLDGLLQDSKSTIETGRPAKDLFFNELIEVAREIYEVYQQGMDSGMRM